jgi:surface-adhesin protein E
MAHSEKSTKYNTIDEKDDGLRKRGLASLRVTDNRPPASDVGIDTPRGRGNSSTRQWLVRSARCWASLLGFSFGTILAAHAASTDKVTAISSSNPLQITSLTAYASQVKHQWTKYAEDNNGTLRQTSYVDLANVIRAGSTATVLNLQDWNPYLRVGTTEERYGSHLSLIQYECGSTSRSKILAQVTFYGHMGSGSQVDGGSDMPKEPADGWYVMPASYVNGQTNFDLKARELACKPSSSAASNTVLSSSRPLQGSTVASRGAPSMEDKMLASDLQNCDRLAQQQSDAAMTLTPVNPVSVLSPILLLNDLNKRKQEEGNQPAALENIERQRLQCRQNAQSVAAQRAQERDNELQDESQGYKRISVETFELDAKSLAANQSKISLKGVYLSDGNVAWLLPSQVDAIRALNDPTAARAVSRVPLITDEAGRDLRQQLLRCRANPLAQCSVVIRGHVSSCQSTTSLGTQWEMACVAVETGRLIR